jgi:hypothetical protein
MTEGEAIEAYAKFAFSGAPLTPVAQAAKLEVQSFIMLEFKALPEGIRKAMNWELFYADRLSQLHREAVRSRNEYPTMPPKA